MKNNKQNKRKDIILSMSPSLWQDIAENKGHSQVGLLTIAIAIELSEGIERQMMAYTYFSLRGQGKTHKQAAKAANSALTKIRKLIGYSYPESAKIAF